MESLAFLTFDWRCSSVTHTVVWDPAPFGASYYIQEIKAVLAMVC